MSNLVFKIGDQVQCGGKGSVMTVAEEAIGEMVPCHVETRDGWVTKEFHKDTLRPAGNSAPAIVIPGNGGGWKPR